jgi:hypothetical protein
MRTKQRLHPYVTPDLAHRLESYCAAKGITVSAFVQAAIQERLKGEPKDIELILRRLDRHDRASVAIQRDQAVLTESFGVFVRTWLALQPPMAEPDKSASERLSARRYDQFVGYVAKQLATGRGLAADVAKGPVGTAEAGAPPGQSSVVGRRDGQ